MGVFQKAVHVHIIPPPPSPACPYADPRSPQELKNNGVDFLRMADNRGWTFARDVEAGGGDPLFTKVSGELVEET